MFQSREDSPVSVKSAGDFVNELDGRRTFMYWMKARTARQYPAAFQKVDIPLVAIHPSLNSRAVYIGVHQRPLFVCDHEYLCHIFPDFACVIVAYLQRPTRLALSEPHEMGHRPLA